MLPKTRHNRDRLPVFAYYAISKVLSRKKGTTNAKMTTPATTDNFECHTCCSPRRRATLKPCSHSEICYICIRRHCSKESRCPICRTEILNIESDPGKQCIDEVRSTYLADERRHLRGTKQLKIFGPSSQTNNLILGALIQHSDESFQGQVDETMCSPNCSYSKKFPELPSTRTQLDGMILWTTLDSLLT